VKAEELRVLEADELAGKLKDSRRELYELRFKLAVGQLDDHRQIRKVRMDIARILTFKRQRELGLLRDDQDAAVAIAPAATEPEAKTPVAEARTEPEPEPEETTEETE
jgi:large subunit ribosomal protein L29